MSGFVISIHAPPRGATFEQMANAIPYIISIHAPPRGATSDAINDIKAERFQFTPLREGRREKQERIFGGHHFNSRPSARGDYVKMGTVYPANISIHAPPRGATHDQALFPAEQDISIHAPPRGATLTSKGMQEKLAISIHAPPRGATLPRDSLRQRDGISIHAPPRGATWANEFVEEAQKFQFTPLREGRGKRC